MHFAFARFSLRRWAGAGVVFGLLFTVACGGSAAPGQTAGGPGRGGGGPRTVQVVAAVEGSLERTIAVTGTLAAEDQVTVSFKVTGRLETLTVDLGSAVEQGQPLGRLVPTDFLLRVTQADAALQQARARLGLAAGGTDEAVVLDNTSVVRQARAVLEQARLTRDRADAFVKAGIGAKADLDAAEAAHKVAEGRYQDAMEEVRNRQALLIQRRAEWELARQALTDSTLTAPFSGRVRERHATPGQYLAVGAPVVTIVRVNPLRLRLSVPERESAAVRLGQTVRVTVEGDSAVHTGRIARVSPAIEEASRTLSLEAEVANPGGLLRPGAFATAEIVMAAREKAMLVPATAIVSFAGVDKVFVVRDGKAVEKRVVTGRRDAGRIEVLAGLVMGDQVVIAPGNLVEGETVTVTAGAPRS